MSQDHLHWMPLATLLSHTPTSLLEPKTDLCLHVTSSTPAGFRPGSDDSELADVVVQTGRPNWNDVMSNVALESQGRVQVMGKGHHFVSCLGSRPGFHPSIETTY